MWWIDGKKIYLKNFDGRIEFIDSVHDTFNGEGFVLEQKRDENLQGYRYDETTKNLQKQKLPFFILKPCKFYSDEIYFECPILFGKVILHEIVYKDYQENHLSLECTILSKESHFNTIIHLNRSYCDFGINIVIPTVIFNLNLLISEDYELRDINLSSKYLLLQINSIEVLFNYINKLDIKFKSFTAFKVGRDDSYHIDSYIIPNKHYFSEYLNAIIMNELKNINIENIGSIQFFPNYDELNKKVSLDNAESHTFSNSAIYKHSQLEFELKDLLKLKLAFKFNPTIHLKSELVQKLEIRQ